MANKQIKDLTPGTTLGDNDLIAVDKDVTEYTRSFSISELIATIKTYFDTLYEGIITTLTHEKGGLEADVSAYSGLVKITGGATSQITDNSSNWNTAYGWGNHASAGYLTSVTAHDLDGSAHNGITGTENNFMALNATGKPKDSGVSPSDFAADDHNHSGTYEPANANIQSHISSAANPHGVTKTQVGLGNVQNINWCDYVPMSVNSITITDDHKGKTIWTTSALSVSAAVASDLGMDFVCGVIQGGAGQVAFSGLGDVTIENQNDHTKTAGLRAAATLRILPDGTCKLIGETA